MQRPVYRPIEVKDIPELFRVRINTWHNPNGAEELLQLGITSETVEAKLQSSHFGWVGEIGNRIVGFAMGDLSNGEMWVIAVLPEYEGMGIGSELLSRVEKELAQAGWKELWLTTDLDDNFRAVQFYKRHLWEDWKSEDGDRFMRKTI